MLRLIFAFVLFAVSASAADMPQPKIAEPKSPTVEMPAVTVPAPVTGQTAPASPSAKPGKLTPAQQLRVAQRVPAIKKQLADLSVDEQRAVLRKAAPPRQKLTDADRNARGQATRNAWAAKTPAMRAELRQKQLAAWQKLSPADRAYRKERMQEQLKALPEDDRRAIIAPFIAGANPAGASSTVVPAP